MLPPIGAIGSVLSPNALAGVGPNEGAGTVSSATAGLGPSEGAGTVSGATAGVESTAGGESGGFGAALTHAISSLEQTQTSGDQAAQALATGTASNPESAVVTVADAQLAMQLASQVRTKAVEAAQQIFQTQV